MNRSCQVYRRRYNNERVDSQTRIFSEAIRGGSLVVPEREINSYIDRATVFLRLEYEQGSRWMAYGDGHSVGCGWQLPIDIDLGP